MNRLRILAFFVFAATSIWTHAQDAIGTPESHRQLWSRYSEAVAKASKLREDRMQRKSAYIEACRPILQELDDAKSQLDSTRKNLEAHIPEKNEFEKTAEFESRKQTLLTKRQANIDALQKNVNDLESRLKSIARPPDVNDGSQIEPVMIQPLSDEFTVFVQMGAYDADTESIASFTVEPIVRFDNGNGPLRIFKSSCRISGITLPPSIAEQARKYSDAGNLVAVFRAKPKPCIYSMSYTAPRSEEQIQSDRHKAASDREVKTGLWQLAAGAFAVFCGHDDPGGVAYQVGEARKAELQKDVKTEDTYDGLVIEIGWEDTHSPEQLRVWDSQKQKSELFWKAQ